MANPKANYEGVEDIMQGFEALARSNPRFSLWQVQPRELLLQYAGENMDEATEMLSQVLTAGEHRGNCDLMAIRLHPDDIKDYVTKNTPYLGTMYIRICPLNLEAGTRAQRERGQVIPIAGPNQVDQLELYKITEAVKAIPGHFDAKFLALEERINAIEVEEPQPEIDYFAKITGLLQQPGIMDGVLGMIRTFFPGVAGPVSPIAGVRESATVANQARENHNETVHQDKLNQGERTQEEIDQEGDEYNNRLNLALDRIEKHCDLVVSLEKLADLADNDPKTFQFLLVQLLRKDEKG